MPDERRSIDAIVEELTTRISQRSSEVDAKFESLSEAQAQSYAQRMAKLDDQFKSLSGEQAKNFATTVNDWEKSLKATASAAEERIREHADRHLEMSVSRIEKNADATSRRIRNIFAVLCVLLFAGSLAFLNEQREKAEEKTIDFQKDLITQRSAIDASMESLRNDINATKNKVQEANSVIEKAKKELADATNELKAKESELASASENLSRVEEELTNAKREYESLIQRLKNSKK